MNIILFIWITVIWILCGILNYGFVFAYFQKEYPSLAEKNYQKDLWFALTLIPFGMMSLLVTIICKYYIHGIKFK